jgi:uncharacterized membrane protein
MPNPTTQAFILGVVSGMRAALGPALVSHKLSQRGSPDLGYLNFMRSPTTAIVLKVAAAGELVGDKLPMTPDRIEPGPLAGRAMSGALCGAALGGAVLNRSSRQCALSGALVGALGAVAGAYAFYYLRRELTHKQGLPDVWVALAEDAVALGAGLRVLTGKR